MADLSALLPFRNAANAYRSRIRLLCFPFAGAGASIYREWSALLPEYVDVCAVELAGRSTRFGEPPAEDVDRLCDELATTLAPLFDRPVVLFGHSMGARISFGLARRSKPGAITNLVVSASAAPHVPAEIQRGEMTREAFIAELERLGGTPREVLDNPELLELVVPILQADFRIADGVTKYAEEKVDCPIVALASKDDTDVDVSDVDAWRDRTTQGFRLVLVPGGHFFVVTHRDLVLAELRKVLDQVDADARR